MSSIPTLRNNESPTCRCHNRKHRGARFLRQQRDSRIHHPAWSFGSVHCQARRVSSGHVVHQASQGGRATLATFARASTDRNRTRSPNGFGNQITILAARNQRPTTGLGSRQHRHLLTMQGRHQIRLPLFSQPRTGIIMESNPTGLAQNPNHPPNQVCDKLIHRSQSIVIASIPFHTIIQVVQVSITLLTGIPRTFARRLPRTTALRAVLIKPVPLLSELCSSNPYHSSPSCARQPVPQLSELCSPNPYHSSPSCAHCQRRPVNPRAENWATETARPPCGSVMTRAKRGEGCF